MLGFKNMFHSTAVVYDEIEDKKEYMLLNYFKEMTEQDKDSIKRWRDRQKPINEAEEFFIYMLEKADEDFYQNFRIQNTEASVKDGQIYYRRGDKVAIDYSLGEWETMVKEFLPECNSRIATLGQEYLFYALRATQYFWSLDDLCYNSNKFGNFWDSPKAAHTFEVSGKREVAGYFDGVGNTSKICMYDEKLFAICGGYFDKEGKDWTIAGHIDFSNNPKQIYKYASAVVVCD